MHDSPEEFTPFVDTAETHSGAVLFIGDRAYKIKKPLDLGFVDYRTVESRRTACEEEVRLNRRLAPDVYLGVGSLSSLGHEEPVVVMRRLPAERRPLPAGRRRCRRRGRPRRASTGSHR